MFELELYDFPNKSSSSFQEQGHSDQHLLNEDCHPWIPVTHPKGAPYFFDRERVRVLVTLKNVSHN